MKLIKAVTAALVLSQAAVGKEKSMLIDGYGVNSTKEFKSQPDGELCHNVTQAGQKQAAKAKYKAKKALTKTKKTDC